MHGSKVVVGPCPITRRSCSGSKVEKALAPITRRSRLGPKVVQAHKPTSVSGDVVTKYKRLVRVPIPQYSFALKFEKALVIITLHYARVNKSVAVFGTKVVAGSSLHHPSFLFGIQSGAGSSPHHYL